MPNPVTWFEIMGKDAEKTRGFYSSLFGWNMNVMPEMNYGMIEPQEGHGTGGGFGGGDQPGVVVFVEVDDLDAYLAKAGSLGGKTVVPPTEVPGMVTFAQFADPDGNVIGLFKNLPQA